MLPFKRTLLILALILGLHAVPGVSRISPEQDKKIEDNKALAVSFIADPMNVGCMQFMITLVGQLPFYGQEETNSMYSRFTHAYHYSLPMVDTWKDANLAAGWDRKVVVRVREVQEDWIFLEGYSRECDHYVNISKYGAEDEAGSVAITTRLRDCSEIEIFGELKRGDFAKRLYKTCYETIHMVASSFWYSTQPQFFQNRHPTWDWSLFGNMYLETLDTDLEIHERLTKTFPQYILKVLAEGHTDTAAELTDRMKEIEDRLKDPSLPYRRLYFKGVEADIQAKRWSSTYSSVKLWIDMNKFLRDPATTLHQKQSYNDHYQGWASDVQNFIGDFNDGSVGHFVDSLQFIYSNYLFVDPLPPGGASTTNAKGEVIGDGMWNWNLDPADQKGIHNMRLAWDLMGGVLEEIKCYMKDTYYFHRRQEALLKTQRNFSQGAMYSGISRTIYNPCRLSVRDETDLVTPYCTAENNEICAPVGPLFQRQRTESNFHGGMRLLRPKWVYKYDESLKRCVGRKDFVMNTYACRCGFRLDCGSDLGGNLTCQLESNDQLRGQCRGDVGYPCKSLPLAPGKYHQSCRSGFCNMKKNSCEDHPYIYRHESRGRPSWKAKSVQELLVMAGVCFGGLNLFMF